jgi:hypothetical protein
VCARKLARTLSSCVLQSWQSLIQFPCSDQIPTHFPYFPLILVFTCVPLFHRSSYLRGIPLNVAVNFCKHPGMNSSVPLFDLCFACFSQVPLALLPGPAELIRVVRKKPNISSLCKYLQFFSKVCPHGGRPLWIALMHGLTPSRLVPCPAEFWASLPPCYSTWDYLSNGANWVLGKSCPSCWRFCVSLPKMPDSPLWSCVRVVTPKSVPKSTLRRASESDGHMDGFIDGSNTGGACIPSSSSYVTVLDSDYLAFLCVHMDSYVDIRRVWTYAAVVTSECSEWVLVIFNSRHKFIRLTEIITISSH